jgi:hypothetical protein
MSRVFANRTFVAVIFAVLAAASSAVARHDRVDSPFPGFERTDRRVVSVQSQTGSGADVQLLRISYTRREPIPAPSR